MPGRFIDTNVLVHLASDDPRKASRAEEVVAEGGNINVQVLNETANVLRRKAGMSWSEIGELLASLRDLLEVLPVTIETHETGLALAARHNFSVWDAMIIASALQADCDLLLSEDMHDGMVLDRRLRIVDPFRAPAE